MAIKTIFHINFISGGIIDGSRVLRQQFRELFYSKNSPKSKRVNLAYK